MGETFVRCVTGCTTGPVLFAYFMEVSECQESRNTTGGLCMRRAILKLADKSTNGGVIIEGIDSCTHHGIPITLIGAKVWCSRCQSEGVIGWKGHRDATMTGK